MLNLSVFTETLLDVEFTHALVSYSYLRGADKRAGSATTDSVGIPSWQSELS